MSDAHVKTGNTYLSRLADFWPKASAEMESNATFNRLSPLIAYCGESTKGLVACLKSNSAVGVIRVARGVFETYIDSALLAKSKDPAATIDEMELYKYVDILKFNRVNNPKFKPTAQMIAAMAHFKVVPPNPKKPNQMYKHWAKIDSIECRACNVGLEDTYNGFYRLASHATHGALAFTELYNSGQIQDVQVQCFSMGLGMITETIRNCMRVGNITNSAVCDSFNQLEETSKKVIDPFPLP